MQGLKLLEYVKLVQQSWVLVGMKDQKSPVKNNVSNTIDVPDNEWDKVKEWVWDNQDYIAGVSFLSTYGDLDLPQPPMCRVLSMEEITREYGVASLFASGLVVDVIKAFKSPDIWKACQTILGRGEVLSVTEDHINAYAQEHKIDLPLDESSKMSIRAILEEKISNKVDNLHEKLDIVRRVKKFAKNYYAGDVYKAVNLLKVVNNLHYFEVLKKTYNPIDWSSVDFGGDKFSNADELGAMSCAGGACEIK